MLSEIYEQVINKIEYLMYEMFLNYVTPTILIKTDIFILYDL